MGAGASGAPYCPGLQMQATMWALSRLLGTSGRCRSWGRAAWYCGPTSGLSTSAGFTMTLGFGALLHGQVQHPYGVEVNISLRLAALLEETTGPIM